jgi:hypothetical protein
VVGGRGFEPRRSPFNKAQRLGQSVDFAERSDRFCGTIGEQFLFERGLRARGAFGGRWLRLYRPARPRAPLGEVLEVDARDIREAAIAEVGQDAVLEGRALTADR